MYLWLLQIGQMGSYIAHFIASTTLLGGGLILFFVMIAALTTSRNILWLLSSVPYLLAHRADRSERPFLPYDLENSIYFPL